MMCVFCRRRSLLPALSPPPLSVMISGCGETDAASQLAFEGEPVGLHEDAGIPAQETELLASSEQQTGKVLCDVHTEEPFKLSITNVDGLRSTIISLDLLMFRERLLILHQLVKDGLHLLSIGRPIVH